MGEGGRVGGVVLVGVVWLGVVRARGGGLGVFLRSGGGGGGGGFWVTLHSLPWWVSSVRL
eukprot:COSAG02_NODE_63965_length_262_cov_0.435583_1_plen_59_part_10